MTGFAKSCSSRKGAGKRATEWWQIPKRLLRFPFKLSATIFLSSLSSLSHHWPILFFSNNFSKIVDQIGLWIADFRTKDKMAARTAQTTTTICCFSFGRSPWSTFVRHGAQSTRGGGDYFSIFSWSIVSFLTLFIFTKWAAADPKTDVSGPIANNTSAASSTKTL